ncbi:MAG: hypothetical protein KGL39_53360 [Patescibacteria group bacterium]|nr:hypothetical protein [Patescibacteria group bacterium]
MSATSSHAYAVKESTGQRIVGLLRPIRSRREVGMAFGISAERVRQIECVALAKMAKRLSESFNFEEDGL